MQLSINCSDGVKCVHCAGVLAGFGCGFFSGCVCAFGHISISRGGDGWVGAWLRACIASCRKYYLRKEMLRKSQHFFSQDFCLIFQYQLTIEILNAFNVVFMQGKVFNIAVHWVHESLFNAGVF